MIGRTAISTLALLLALTGCSTTPTESWTRTGDPLVDGRAAIAAAPEKDRVLWQYRTGLSAFRQGNYAEAEQMFDAALSRVGAILTPDKSAKKARSYFSEEAKKTFLGEPYERVMAYFYRGILYWMNGEPDNARACFRNAQIQDSDTENREYANDWVLMDYLDGFVTAKYYNGDGADAFKRAAQSFKLGQLPEYTKNVNTMVFLEFGQGPTKYATGEYGEQLRIKPGQSTVNGAWVKIANKAVRIVPYDDVNFQATTRGGRVMDHILANKAVFKSATDTFGTAAIIGGAVVAAHHGSEEVGLGILAAGVVSKIFAAATTPNADTRAWENLPGYISFTMLELPPGPHTATIEFTDAAGNLLPSLTKTINFSVTAGNDVVLFASDHNS
jgi:tetratricopeptide (TPR) repeat protein